MKRLSLWLSIGTLLLLYGAVTPSVSAVDCSRTPGGNVTISSSCTFPGTIDGADVGSGSSNTADIAVSGGATLTIGAGQTISTGTLTPSGGSIAVISGGQIKIGSPLWMYDADGDGYPKESTMAAQAAADPGWRRRNLMTSLTQRDCQDFSNSGYGCVPATNDLTNGTYSGAYQESAGNPAQSYRELPVDINTVGLWHMNEASGNMTDSSGNANTGTPTGTTVVAGKFGNGRSFNGTSDRVQFADTASLKLPLPYTIEFWLKSTSAAETVIISRTPHPDTWSWNYLITTNQAGGKLRFTTGSSGYNTNTDVFDGVWHHVAISINSQGALQWYIDGAAKESYTGAITDSGASIVCLSSYQTNSSTCSSTYFYDGLIDEMRISNIARTAEEIKANAQRKPSAVYTAPVNDLGQTPGSWSGMTVKAKGVRTGDGETLHSTNSLIAQWNFNETSGTTAAASAGSCGASCNGTLTNFASTASQDQAAGTGWTANNKRWGAGALMFDGSNDYVQVSSTNKVANSANSTVEAWMNWSGKISTTNTIYGEDQSDGVIYTLAIDTVGRPTFNIWVSGTWYTTLYSSTLEPGKWNHLVGTFSTTAGTKLYLNGINVKSSPSNTAQNVSTVTSVQLGRTTNGGGANYFQGILDSVRTYSRTLTAAEILANYQAGNVELQTRTSADNSTWEAWKPVTGETAIDAMDSLTTSVGLTGGNQITTATLANSRGFWNLNESTVTSATDGSGNGNTLTNSGTTVVSSRTAQFGNARTLNGSSDYLYCTDAACGGTSKLDSGSGNWSVGAWMKSSQTTQGMILSKGGGADGYYNYELQINEVTAGKAGFRNYTTANGNYYYLQSTTSVNDNTWHFVVGTYTASNTTARIYVDGVLENTVVASGTQQTDVNGQFEIGRRMGGTGYFNGTIDDVFVTANALTATEIQQFYLGNPKAVFTTSDTTFKIEGTASEKLQIGAPQVDASTVGLWHLEKTSGTGAYIQDATANNNDGTPTGTGVVDGFYGKGRSFNGTSEYVSIADANSLDVSKLTVETWFKRSTTGTSQGLVSKYNHPAGLFWMIINSSNQLQLSICDETNCGNNFMSQISTTTITDNNWHFAVGTWSGGTTNSSISLYLDGVLISSTGDTNGTFSTPGTDANLEIGRQYASANYFNGSIDEVRVSNTNRTAEEIAEAYRVGRDHRLSRTITAADLSAKTKLPFYVAADRPGTFLEATIGESAYANYESDANTVGLWHLEEAAGSGAYIKDSSGRGNDFTLTGSATLGVAGKIGKGITITSSGSNYLRKLSASSLPTGTNDFTLGLWFKRNGNFSSLYNSRIITFATTDSNNSVAISGQTGNNKILLETYGGGSGSFSDYTNTGITDNNWHWIVGVRRSSGTVLDVYVDGSLAASTTVTARNFGTPDRIVVGMTAELNTDTAVGAFSLDEPFISNTARTADEIRQAYEIGKRTHPVTIDFVTSPQAAYSSGTSVTINNPWGTTNLTDALSVGDTMIFKENVGGTETVSQAVVNAITNTSSTYGTVTLASAPTFPSGGYTTNATVFKWQREYFDPSASLGTHRDATTRLTLRVTDGSEGANVWLDDFRSASYINRTTCDTLNATTGECTYLIPAESITSTLNRYAQIRAIMSTWDTAVSPIFTSSQIEYGL